MTDEASSRVHRLLLDGVDGKLPPLSSDDATVIKAKLFDSYSELGRMRRTLEKWQLREAQLVEQVTSEETRAAHAEGALSLCLWHLREVTDRMITGNARRGAFAQARRWLRIFDTVSGDVHEEEP